MTDEDWSSGHALAIGLFLNGDSITDPDTRGQRIVDDSFLLLFNAHHEEIDWALPMQWGGPWSVVLDPTGTHEESVSPGGKIRVPARSVVILTHNTDCPPPPPIVSANTHPPPTQ